MTFLNPVRPAILEYPGFSLTDPTAPQGKDGQELWNFAAHIMEQLRKQPPHILTAPSVWNSYSATMANELQARLSPLAFVQAVFFQSLPQGVSVFVLLQQEQYDEAVMDALLDVEADLLDGTPDALLDFHYLPVLTNDPATMVPQNSVLVFMR